MQNEWDFTIEPLECRKMMAADIDVSGSTLRIRGDSADDVVHVFGSNVEGEVFVKLGDNDPVVFDGIRSLRVDLRDGDDTLYLSSLKVDNDVNVQMGDGADFFVMDNEPAETSIHDTVIGDDLSVRMGNDVGDRILWQTSNQGGHSIIVRDDVVMRGAASVIMIGHGPVDGDATPGFEAQDIAIGDRLQISVTDKRVGMYGPPEIELTNVNVGGDTRLSGSRASDEIFLSFCSFLDDFSVHARAGDDAIVIWDTTRFEDRATFHGGSGEDTLANRENRVFLSSSRDDRFEFLVTFEDEA